MPDRYGEAERLFRQVLERRRAALGPGHPDTLRCEVVVARLAMERGALDEAEALLEHAVSAYRRARSADDARSHAARRLLRHARRRATRGGPGQAA